MAARTCGELLGILEDLPPESAEPTPTSTTVGGRQLTMAFIIVFAALVVIAALVLLCPLSSRLARAASTCGISRYSAATIKLGRAVAHNIVVRW